jgi:hypothetical protein
MRFFLEIKNNFDNLKEIWVKFNKKFEFWKLSLNCFIKVTLLVLSWDLKNSRLREIMQLW